MYKQTSDINSNDLVTYLFASNCSVQSFSEYCDRALGAGSTHQRSSSHKRDRSPTSLPSPSLLKSVSPHYRVPSAAGSAPSAPSAAHPPTTLPLPLRVLLVSAYPPGESSPAPPRSASSSALLPRHTREQWQGPLFSSASTQCDTEAPESPRRRRPSTASARTCTERTRPEGTTCAAAVSATAGRE